ncbi:hypothetical protein FISHEDRAFT_71368 [Fistulina hepatica ATCC 64428]|nr:hypothetical protein FISHEDRAFT_71368 [Fistulina hepatica ATCC 64428]
MPSSLYIPFLLAGMIITGSSNSLWTKWQDMQCVENCDDPDPRKRVLFEQPVWQTLQMFAGEMLCAIPVLYTWLLATHRRSPPVHLPSESDPLKPPVASQPLTGWKVLLLWIPAACDLTGTTLMNVGLLYTPVSIYQMTRGALVLFVGILSVVFLRRRLWLYQWVSLLVVMTGVALVGFSGSMIKDVIRETPALNSIVGRWIRADSPSESTEEPEVTAVLVGVFFILFAQFVVEGELPLRVFMPMLVLMCEYLEKILGRYSVAPLVAVGYEGLFGAITVLLCLPVLSIPSIAAKSPFFDIPRGWNQMIHTSTVITSSIIIAFSIGLFNYFGLSVTRHVSATARSLTDTCRTLAIWLVSLGLGWEKLLFPISLLQILGFTLLVYGTFLFNNLVSPPSFLRSSSVDDDPEANEEADALLSASLDETAAFPADIGQSGFNVVPVDDVRAHARPRSPIARE